MSFSVRSPPRGYVQQSPYFQPQSPLRISQTFGHAHLAQIYSPQVYQSPRLTPQNIYHSLSQQAIMTQSIHSFGQPLPGATKGIGRPLQAVKGAPPSQGGKPTTDQETMLANLTKENQQLKDKLKDIQEQHKQLKTQEEELEQQFRELKEQQGEE